MERRIMFSAAYWPKNSQNNSSQIFGKNIRSVALKQAISVNVQTSLIINKFCKHRSNSQTEVGHVRFTSPSNICETGEPPPSKTSQTVQYNLLRLQFYAIKSVVIRAGTLQLFSMALLGLWYQYLNNTLSTSLTL